MTDRLRTSTYFGLLAEFGSAEIPLDDVAPRWFGLTPEQARRRAAVGKLPVPAYRLGTQKARWMVSAQDLADRIDAARAEARDNWIASAS